MKLKPLHLGHSPAGSPIYLSPEARRKHMHIIGASDSGKSRFLEHLLRQHLRNGDPFLLLDWHGNLSSSVIQYARRLHVGLFRDRRKLIVINPSEPSHIVPVNFFSNRTDTDPSVQVRRRLAITIRSLGSGNTEFLPRFERICALLYGFACESGEALPNLMELLSFPNAALRMGILEQIRDPYLKLQWEEIVQIKNHRDWSQLTESTVNRLNPYLTSKALMRFIGLPKNSIDLLELMNQPSFIIVNLARSGFLDENSARLFASLFLLEIFEAAIRRANQCDPKKRPDLFTLYLDESQNYMDDSLGQMLDEVRKGGIALNVCHQHLGQVESPRLKESLLTNCGTRVVFRGGSFPSTSELVNEVFLPEINRNRVKNKIYHTAHDYAEETRVVRSRSRSQQHSESKGQGRASTVGRQRSSSIGFSRTQGQSHTNGKSHTTGSSHTDGSTESLTYTYGHAEASSSGTGQGSGVTHAIGTPMDGSTELANQQYITEVTGESTNKFSGQTVIDSQSDSNGVSYSEADTISETDTLSKADTESLAETESDSTTNGSSHSQSKSESDSTTRGQSHSAGESIVPFLKPVPRKELSSVQFYSLEEKRSLYAEKLKHQSQRHAWVQIGNDHAEELIVPLVDDPKFSKKYVQEYMERVYQKQGAIPANQADQMLEESRRQFLNKGQRKVQSSKNGRRQPIDPEFVD